MSILRQITIRHLGWLYAAAQRHLYTLFATCEPAHCQWRIMATPPLLIAVAKDVKRVTCPAVRWWSFLNAVDCRGKRHQWRAAGHGQRFWLECFLTLVIAAGRPLITIYAPCQSLSDRRWGLLSSTVISKVKRFWVQQWYRRSNFLLAIQNNCVNNGSYNQ